MSDGRLVDCQRAIWIRQFSNLDYEKGNNKMNCVKLGNNEISRIFTVFIYYITELYYTVTYEMHLLRGV